MLHEKVVEYVAGTIRLDGGRSWETPPLPHPDVSHRQRENPLRGEILLQMQEVALLGLVTTS